jgi:formylglycine-generating enzyme required for sulfatase activity
MIWERDGKEMVRVPAGEFLYGDKKKKVELPEFWIDKTPVTNAEYARFVAATGHEPPKHWKGKAPPKKIADHPVIYVPWHDAVAYAEWAGKRLPTEQEWEKAARGTDGRKYPWGDQEPTSELCNFEEEIPAWLRILREEGLEEPSTDVLEEPSTDVSEIHTTPVGKYSPQGDSPYGCMDMAGNVWEWTASDYDKSNKVLRGGSWSNRADLVRGAYRFRSSPVYRGGNVGFRCARGSQ